jgi:hypothetical protein
MPMAERLRKKGFIDQPRHIQEIQIRSMIEANRDVKLILSGHQHFNQVGVHRNQLHCITQDSEGLKEYGDTPGVRVINLGDNTVTGKLIWDGPEESDWGEIGTEEGDRAFRWIF